jgi:hypothetical protein
LRFRWLIVAVIFVIASVGAFFVFDAARNPNLTRNASQSPSVPPASAKSPLETPQPTGPKPHAVVVGDPTYHFGTKTQETSFTKEWIVENQGDADLTLEPEPPSCSCITFQIPSGLSFSNEKKITVKPYAKAPVSFGFETKKFSGRYLWPMSLVTNDPDHPKLVFAAEGIIRAPFAFEPESGINFLDICSDDESNHASIKLLCFERADLQVIKIKPTKPDLMAVQSRPLDPSECRVLGIQSGYQFDVTIKRGAPTGSFREIVYLDINHPSKPEIGFVVLGRVRLPIAAVPEQVRMVDVSTSKGGESTTQLIVRGRRVTQFHLEHAPDHVQVEILPADPTNPVGTYRLNTRVLPGARPGRIKDAIVIATDHPQQPQIKIPIEILLHAG